PGIARCPTRSQQRPVALSGSIMRADSGTLRGATPYLAPGCRSRTEHGQRYVGISPDVTRVSACSRAWLTAPTRCAILSCLGVSRCPRPRSAGAGRDPAEGGARPMFTIEQREALRDRLLRLAAADARVVAGAAVGSLAADGGGDRFSDLDLTFAVADHVPVAAVLADWARTLTGELAAVHL